MSSFRTEFSTPTEEQAALVGHVVMDSAILEFNLQTLVGRLSLAPDLPARVILSRSGPGKLAVYARKLLELHEKRYSDRLISYDRRLAIAAALDIAEKSPALRNRFAHWISLRNDDDTIDMFDLLSAVLADDDKRYASKTAADLRQLLVEIRRANDALEAAISLIPPQMERLPA